MKRPLDGQQTMKVHTFNRPPVVETALGIQFDELKGFKAIDFGLFYELIRDRFAHAEDQHRLEPIIEPFPKARRTTGIGFRTQVVPERVWFKDEAAGSTLLQLQPDRLGFNWRQPEGQTSRYPSYSANVRRFLEEFDRFTEFCRNRGLGAVCPNLCEVIYINHIWPKQDETAVDLFASIFSDVHWEESEFLPKPEAATLNRVYVIGENLGRLYAEASIALHKARGEFIQLKMVARVLHTRIVDTDERSVQDNLQLAHDWAVEGFIDLTDEDTRKQRWEQLS